MKGATLVLRYLLLQLLPVRLKRTTTTITIPTQRATAATWRAPHLHFCSHVRRMLTNSWTQKSPQKLTLYWPSCRYHPYLFFSLGLRISVLLIAFLSVFGKCLQLIPASDNKMRTIFINVGQFIIMAGGTVALSAPPLVSATWFPPSERTTATAISALAGSFGISVAFVVGPAMVRNKVPESIISNSSNSEKMQNLVEIMSHRITQYSFFQVGLCIATFICVLLYFPARPPLPPSLTASRPHTQSTAASFRQVMRNGKFLLLSTLAALDFGVYFSWLSVLDVFLAKFDVDPTTAGWLGCGATSSGFVSGILLARYAGYSPCWTTIQ